MLEMIKGSPMLIMLLFNGSKIFCVLLLLLFYRFIKKIGVSIGPWIWSISLFVGLLAGAPYLFLNGEHGVIPGCIYIIVFAVATIIIQKLALNSVKKTDDKQRDQINFYKKCISNGIKSLDSEKSIARAQVIAKEFKSANGVDVNKYFTESEELVKKLNEQHNLEQKNSELASKKSEEAKEYLMLSCYHQCIENEKTIQILEKRLQETVNEKNRRESFQRRASSVMLDKEKDWASLGGAASAIGGPIAGAAVALDVQAKNAEIRARNAQTSANLSQFQMQLNKSADAMSGSIDSLRQRIADEKIKLTKKLTKDEVLKCLDITVDSVEISETGAFRVKTLVKLKKPMIIFDDVSARIDGSFTCILSQNGNAVGEAKLVLPLYGMYPTTRESIEVKGICLKGAIPGEPYTIAVVLDNIWAVEN